MATRNLNVEFEAVADVKGKFGRLAKLLGLADADHARGKCEHLWVACTTRGETALPQWLVEQVLGERGPAALVEAELATWGRDVAARRLRIHGTGEMKPCVGPVIVTYAIEACGCNAVKVGRTTDVDRRIAELQTSHHTNLEVIGVVAGDVEQAIHGALDALGKRRRGEWFDLDERTMLVLADHGIGKGY